MVSSITEAKQLKAPDVCMLDLSDHPDETTTEMA